MPLKRTAHLSLIAITCLVGPVMMSPLAARSTAAPDAQGAQFVPVANLSQAELDTALKHALAANDAARTRTALQQGANANTRFSGPEQETALILSIKHANKIIASLLLEHKANPDATSASGKTPLLHAANLGSLSLVSVLLKAGAKVNHQDLEDGATALLLAARHADRPLVRRLLQANADPNIADNRRGNTPLIVASARPTGYATVVALIGAGARVNQTARDGWSPLMSSVAQGNVDTTELLLLNGANVQAVTTNNIGAMQLAIQGGFSTILTQLLQRQTAARALLASGETALTLAVDGQRHDIVHQLLDRNTDVNTMNSRGLSPLMFAVTRGDNYLTSLLLGAGANVNQVSSVSGNTALMIAANRDIPELVELLLVAGADASIKANDGWTALEAATMVGSEASAELIRRSLAIKR